jgi:SAM-dependent methyltransferase
MAPDLLKGETFDLIFMSYGVIVWHEDLSPLAELIERCLAPDGRLLLVEFHPHMQMYDDSNTVIEHSYFMDGPIEGVQEGSYATEQDTEPIPYVVWNHSLGEVMNTFIGAGLILEFVQEYDFSPYPCFENLVQVDEERWMVKGLEGKIPMCFALRARKEE